MQRGEGSLVGRAIGRPEPRSVDAHVPVREVVHHEVHDCPDASRHVVVGPGLTDGADHVVEPGEQPSIHRRPLLRGRRAIARHPILRVRTEEIVGAAQRVQEPARDVGDLSRVEALGEPDLALTQQVQPHGVGAVLLDHLPGVHHVPLGLGHLLAVGVEHELVDDHMLIGGRIKHAHRDGEQRVEPAARLVHALADEVRGEVSLEIGLMLERVVPLRDRHRARIEPRVDHLRHAAHGAVASVARPRVAVDEGLVGIEVRRQGLTPALGQLGERADHVPVLAIPVTLPHVERRAPVAIARQRPVDVVLQPLAEAARPDLGRVPVHGRVHLEHPRLDGRGADEP